MKLLNFLIDGKYRTKTSTLLHQNNSSVLQLTPGSMLVSLLVFNSCSYIPAWRAHCLNSRPSCTYVRGCVSRKQSGVLRHIVSVLLCVCCIAKAQCLTVIRGTHFQGSCKRLSEVPSSQRRAALLMSKGNTYLCKKHCNYEVEEGLSCFWMRFLVTLCQGVKGMVVVKIKNKKLGLSSHCWLKSTHCLYLFIIFSPPVFYIMC